ncbi:MAG: hypothetical protein ORN54_03025 [Cyclobacteriaceae bacterium]|nr:hypothetical protein [Cyclobacteriaceae bacterium]
MTKINRAKFIRKSLASIQSNLKDTMKVKEGRMSVEMIVYAENPQPFILNNGWSDQPTD